MAVSLSLLQGPLHGATSDLAADCPQEQVMGGGAVKTRWKKPRICCNLIPDETGITISVFYWTNPVPCERM